MSVVQSDEQSTPVPNKGPVNQLGYIQIAEPLRRGDQVVYIDHDGVAWPAQVLSMDAPKISGPLVFNFEAYAIRVLKHRVGSLQDNETLSFVRRDRLMPA